MRDVSHKVKHHLQHESVTLPEPALCLHGFEPLRRMFVAGVSYILVNNHSRTVPVVHQEAGGRRDTNTECQREFVVDVAFDESLTNNEISNTRVSLIKYLPPCV